MVSVAGVLQMLGVHMHVSQYDGTAFLARPWSSGRGIWRRSVNGLFQELLEFLCFTFRREKHALCRFHLDLHLFKA